MQINSILSQHRVACDVEAGSKKKLLEQLAQLISEDQPQLDSEELFLNLVNRERLGSTGLGGGIAIPHCRLSNCEQTLAAVIKLTQAIEYEAVDGEPVDLVFALVVPEQAHDEHLQTLASLAERLQQNAYLQQLRDAEDNHTLYQAAIALD